jgi:hypothetical protein
MKTARMGRIRKIEAEVPTLVRWEVLPRIDYI